MTDYFPFQPSQQGPFQFQPTLDGTQYTAQVKWNLFGQRWYLTLSDQSGNVIFTKAVVGSPDGRALQALVWDGDTGTGQVTATTAAPHGLNIGETVALTIAGVSPDTFNGDYLVLVTDESAFTYALSPNPGSVTVLGQVFDNVSLAESYFTSAMIFRESSQTFEVS